MATASSSAIFLGLLARSRVTFMAASANRGIASSLIEISFYLEWRYFYQTKRVNVNKIVQLPRRFKA